MRIRTVKPEFFNHEGLFDLEHETGLPVRIAFIGLWCAADREGRFKWEPRRLKTQILPYDELQFSDLLDALSRRGFIIRYGQAGEFGQIPSFLDHQCINQREAQSTLPDPADAPEQCTHMHAHASTCTHVGKGREGNKEGNKERNKEKPPKSPKGDGGFDEFWKIYPKPVGKAKAIKVWQKLKPNLDEIKAALAWQTALPQWNKDDRQYVPHPTTYLNERRWEDVRPGTVQTQIVAVPNPDGPPKDYLEILNDEDIIPYEIKFHYGGKFARWRDLPEDARQKIRAESARREQMAG